MYKYGDRVRIKLPQSGSAITQYMKGFDGIEAIIERASTFAGHGIYELYGVMSEKGKAYTFEEEWLEPVGEEQNNEADGTSA